MKSTILILIAVVLTGAIGYQAGKHFAGQESATAVFYRDTRKSVQLATFLREKRLDNLRSHIESDLKFAVSGFRRLPKKPVEGFPQDSIDLISQTVDDYEKKYGQIPDYWDK